MSRSSSGAGPSVQLRAPRAAVTGRGALGDDLHGMGTRGSNAVSRGLRAFLGLALAFGASWIAALLIAALALAITGCEGDALSRQMEAPFDAGFEDDAEPLLPPPPPPPPDAGFAPDAAPPPPPHDAGFAPDARPVNDGGFVPATEPVYVCSELELHSFDPATRTTTRIGAFAPFNGETMIDIAIDLDGRLLGGTYSGGIYEIDPQTARVRLISRAGSMPTGLTFLSDGRLIFAGAQVRVVDPVTGNQSGVITANAPPTSGDIIGLPDGSLYATVIGDQGLDELVRIDPVSGAVTPIGALGVAEVFGLAYANGTMFGFTASGEVLVIDHLTARITDRRAVPGSWYGATTNPVLW